MTEQRMAPVHPGEILYEEFMLPLELSQNQLARDLGVPPRRINELVHGTRRLTADTALRLARHFKQSPEFWLGLQMRYDLDLAEDEAGVSPATSRCAPCVDPNTKKIRGTKSWPADVEKPPNQQRAQPHKSSEKDTARANLWCDRKSSLTLLLRTEPAQAQRIAHHRHRTHRHRCSSEHRVK